MSPQQEVEAIANRVRIGMPMKSQATLSIADYVRLLELARAGARGVARPIADDEEAARVGGINPPAKL